MVQAESAITPREFLFLSFQKTRKSSRTEILTHDLPSHEAFSARAPAEAGGVPRHAFLPGVRQACEADAACPGGRRLEKDAEELQSTLYLSRTSALDAVMSTLARRPRVGRRRLDCVWNRRAIHSSIFINSELKSPVCHNITFNFVVFRIRKIWVQISVPLFHSVQKLSSQP